MARWPASSVRTMGRNPRSARPDDRGQPEGANSPRPAGAEASRSASLTSAMVAAIWPRAPGGKRYSDQRADSHAPPWTRTRRQQRHAPMAPLGRSSPKSNDRGPDEANPHSSAARPGQVLRPADPRSTSGSWIPTRTAFRRLSGRAAAAGRGPRAPRPCGAIRRRGSDRRSGPSDEYAGSPRTRSRTEPWSHPWLPR